VQCLEGLTRVTWPCYVAGDFNAGTIDWPNLSVTCHSVDNIQLDFAINNGFTQLVKYPTRNDNILDIVLVNEPNAVFDVHVDLPFGCSDHSRVDFTVVLELALTSNIPDASTKQSKCYQWGDADYEGIGDFLASYDWDQLFCLNPTVNEMWLAFSNVMYSAIDIYVPSVSSRTHCRPGKRYYPKKLRKTISCKRCLWRKYRADHGNSLLRQRYLDAAAQCRKALHDYEIAKEMRVINSNNVGRFYKHINNRLSCHSGIGVLRNEDGTVFTNDNDKASLLNEYFCDACTCDNGQLPDFARVAPLDANLSEIIFTTDNIAKVLRHLKANSSCGPDGFPPNLLKKLAPQLSYPLSVLFNNSMSTGKIPDAWRCAIVTPIAKGGVASDVDNYRPISLTSGVCKVMERVIVKYLSDYLYEHKLISRQQHGFIRRKSTSTNLLETLNDWTLAIDNGDSITAAYIDFAKAFDSVSHQKLLHKLQGYGISGNLINWIKDFLFKRLQCTKVGDTLSQYKHLISGVIQGSCLGPLLFVIYVNDIVTLFGQDCVCKLYADDLKLYMRINSTHCASSLRPSWTSWFSGLECGSLTYLTKNVLFLELVII